MNTGTDDGFDTRAKAKAEHVLAVISGQRSEADHVFLDNHLFKCSFSIQGNFETRDLELQIAEVGQVAAEPGPVTFKFQLPSSAGCNMKFVATDGTVLLVQVVYDTRTMGTSHLTLLMNIHSGEVTELSRDIPEIVDCVVSPDWCVYRKDDQPSLATYLDVHTGLSRVLAHVVLSWSPSV